MHLELLIKNLVLKKLILPMAMTLKAQPGTVLNLIKILKRTKKYEKNIVRTTLDFFFLKKIHGSKNGLAWEYNSNSSEMC